MSYVIKYNKFNSNYLTKRDNLIVGSWSSIYDVSSSNFNEIESIFELEQIFNKNSKFNPIKNSIYNF